MATAREESSFGAGGKFKKRPFRRQTTPYDRPSTVLRNSSNVNINSNSGWLSKLIDPAQKLIASSAQRFFSSVFRKRLPPPPPPPPVPEPNHEAKNIHQEDSKDFPSVQGEITSHDDDAHISGGGQLTELEQILKQKTFTRSEIDQLTALLRSKTADIPVEDEHRRPELMPSEVIVSHNRKEVGLTTPPKENGIGSQSTSMPVVVDDDVASPAEIAKAYMGNRPSQVSPSSIGLRSQTFRGESTAQADQSLPSGSPVMALMPRSSVHFGVPENSFVTPRSRGRSAIYSMARTPYSGVQSTMALKGARTPCDTVAGPSLTSQCVWEKNRSKQGTLKRRISVLESDVGSIGPIRRIRQKPNLLSSKFLSLPAVGGSLAGHATCNSDDAENPSSSMQKPLLLRDLKNTSAKVVRNNKDNNVCNTCFTPIPSKSNEMASKILQQLDKLVSSKEKSSMKLSASMLSGPALKSLENVDSSILIEKVQDNNESDGPTGTFLDDARDSTSQKKDSISQKKDKVKENGPMKLIDKPNSVVNGLDTSVTTKYGMPNTRPTDSDMMNKIGHAYPQKRRAFQMSAHEDCLDLDDDDYSNATAPTPLAEGRDSTGRPVSVNNAASELTKPEKSSALPGVKLSNSRLQEISDVGTSGGSVAKSSAFAFVAGHSDGMTVQPASAVTASTLTSNKIPLANESNAASIFSFSEKAASPNESELVSSTFNPSTINVQVPQSAPTSSSAVGVSLSSKTGTLFETKPGSSSTFTSAAVGAVDSLPKVPVSDATNDVSKGGYFSQPSETAPPSAPSTSLRSTSHFTFATSANSSAGVNNGSVASSSSSISSTVANDVSSQNPLTSATTTFAASNTDGTPTTTIAPISTTDATAFEFGSSAFPSTSVSSTAASYGVESMHAKVKGTSSGNSTSNPFGGTSAFVSTGNHVFGGTMPAVTGTGSSLFAGTSSSIGTESTLFAGSSSSSTGTGSSLFAGTLSTTTGTGSGVVFAGSCSLATTTGSGIFGATASAIPSAGSTFGFTASAANKQSQIANPCSADTQASNGTLVASSNQSTVFQFGTSASLTPFGSTVNSSSSSPFGSAVNSSSSSPFGSAVNSSSSSPFGSIVNSSSSSPFGSALNSSSSSPFSSLATAAKPFSSGPTFGLSSSTTSLAPNSVSSSVGTASTMFGIPTANSSSSSIGFAFGASASSASTSSAPIFGSSSSASSSSIFSFNSASAVSPAQSAFGSVNSVFPFGSTPTNNNTNDHMNMEDSMAEDTVQGSTPSIPVFGHQQPATPPQSGFVFGSATPSGTHPFPYGGQPNKVPPQNLPLSFQASSSSEFNAGGTFSLGSGSVDKSQRKIVRVRKQRGKK